ncbi:rod shape-determining protein MreC [Flavobacteriaceae bacterium S356]|uniref:Cell shape-determining protein MreC n=1 Tax=Asprobacillus argus TaxID=3076534 RepID=A0ABU3LFX1_9FLAO|nr:rod shape-determining protein MreC [Flavobacteriaceae bacterium S356]
MQQLIYFIQKYKYFLFFLLLEFVALFFTINNHSFHKSKFISSANSLTGGLYEKASEFSEYLDLKTTNEGLAKENTRLKNELEKIKNSVDSTVTSTVNDSTVYYQKYTYTLAKAINNKFSATFNFLTLNKGEKDGIKVEMAVTNDKGIIGITDQVSGNYTRVRSILNKNSSINARVKGDSIYFGNLKWDGKDIRILQLENIPRQAVVKVGDTVITGGKSTIFPEGVLIGTVSNINAANSTTSSTINVLLFNDMKNIRHVYVISNLDKDEIRTVENNNNE